MPEKGFENSRGALLSLCIWETFGSEGRKLDDDILRRQKNVFTLLFFLVGEIENHTLGKTKNESHL